MLTGISWNLCRLAQDAAEDWLQSLPPWDALLTQESGCLGAAAEDKGHSTVCEAGDRSCCVVVHRRLAEQLVFTRAAQRYALAVLQSCDSLQSKSFCLCSLHLPDCDKPAEEFMDVLSEFETAVKAARHKTKFQHIILGADANVELWRDDSEVAVGNSVSGVGFEERAMAFLDCVKRLGIILQSTYAPVAHSRSLEQ